MFDLGWPELLLIGIVALIVMGDDFPTMFRTLGRFTGKMRKMAREFSRAMEEAADESGVKDVSNSLKAAASPKSMGLDALNKAAGNYEKWEAGTKRKKPGSGDDAKKPAAETPNTPEKTAEKAPEKPAASKRPAPPAAATVTADDTAAAPDPETPKATDTGT